MSYFGHMNVSSFLFVCLSVCLFCRLLLFMIPEDVGRRWCRFPCHAVSEYLKVRGTKEDRISGYRQSSGSLNIEKRRNPRRRVTALAICGHEQWE
jgi:hypothetical protein